MTFEAWFVRFKDFFPPTIGFVAMFWELLAKLFEKLREYIVHFGIEA